ncbi:hypothetical protein [Desulfosoma sp.]|uniref:hypothetical protein n=1 Tax=Desulfosoma sp. TaxID=2603217 RepID=UPI004049998D
MLTQVLQQITPFHGTALWGTNVTRVAAVSNRWIGSSKWHRGPWYLVRLGDLYMPS